MRELNLFIYFEKDEVLVIIRDLYIERLSFTIFHLVCNDMRWGGLVVGVEGGDRQMLENRGSFFKTSHWGANPMT